MQCWRADRARFAALAHRLDVPLLILHFHADPAVLVERVNARARGPRGALNASNASDAGEAVLAAQMASADPLDSAERRVTVDLDTDVPMDAFASTAWWAPLFERMTAMRETGTASA